MKIKIGNRITDIALKSKEENEAIITLDGRDIPINMLKTENGVYSILVDDKSYQAHLVYDEQTLRYDIQIREHHFIVEIHDEKQAAKRKRKELGQPKDAISSPMPGKVVDVLVKEGQEVKAGDTVIVIEAMKMQSNYKVEADAVVKQIHVKAGESIQANQKLISLESQD